jgi:transcriptional regulator with XRE-family HTH domain
MIKNDLQLKRAKTRLKDIRAEISEYQEEYTGIERDILIYPLMDEKRSILNDIEEFTALRNLPFEKAVVSTLNKPELIDNIGQLLAKLRIAAKLTQQEMAQRLGWDQPNVSRFESETYNSQTIAKVVEYAAALGIWLHVRPSMRENPVEIRFSKRQHPYDDEIDTTTTEFDVMPKEQALSI